MVCLRSLVLSSLADPTMWLAGFATRLASSAAHTIATWCVDRVGPPACALHRFSIRVDFVALVLASRHDWCNQSQTGRRCLGINMCRHGYNYRIVLDLFVGQLPFSGNTLLDVDGQTYGAQDELRRRTQQEDSLWLAEQLRQLRAQPANCLATAALQLI